MQQTHHALALYCGLHSPPVLDGLAMVHEEQLLLLDPWAAAAPITRFNAKTNWVFRLSLDDSKVGRFLVDHLVEDRSFSSPALLLENTGWGRLMKKIWAQRCNHTTFCKHRCIGLVGI